ncbi:hypothetical protein ACHHYP_11612 [Achlya hypogyna]|uniref:Uncharacterized protein n=1 Tax=Achlya hypogyna TaxID=1202772 RepID=A0A1V9YIU5_ACHHY|nr:hypothetical protein ACHHYP_11612 [Achlya hypogyna]
MPSIRYALIGVAEFMRRRREGRYQKNHHNRVARWVCVEMLALYEVKHVVTKKDKLGFLNQWWTLLHELKWTVTASDDDAPIRTKATVPEDGATTMANDTADAHATDAPTTELMESTDEPMDGEDIAPPTTEKAPEKATDAPGDETQVAGDAKEVAEPDEMALLFVLFDEVCQLMPEAGAFRAKMAAVFGATTYALTDATSDWILAAAAARKEELAQAE